MNNYEPLKREILESGLFNADWYKEKYRDVEFLGLEPLDHYVRFGILMQRDPSPGFSTRFYLAAYPDVTNEGEPPLLHYIRHGRKEGRTPTPYNTDYGATLISPQPASAPDLSSRPVSASVNARWVWRLANDAFMLRGLERLSSVAVVVNVNDDAGWRTALQATSRLDTSDGVDLFLLGPVSLDFSDIPENVNSISHLGPVDERGNAKGFVRYVTSGAADRYEALLWFSPQDATPKEDIDHSIRAATAFLKDADWGCAADQIVDIQTTGGEPLLTTLRTALPRLGLSLPPQPSKMIYGAVAWFKPLLLRALGPTIRPFEMTADEDGKPFPGRLSVLAVLSHMANAAGMKVKDTRATEISSPSSSHASPRDLKTIAFYLPQFHPIPENDKWWGKGFTEWSNVVRGKPLFRNHYQPRVPADLGYYDLRLEDTLVAQANLAREFGIHGFCYYYYWFNGKKLLNHPIEQMARSSRSDTGFCVCWANENWSRNWDGQNRHVLLSQEYSLESNIELIRELIPMMKDPRWIRHNGRPVMMVYRISIIPNWLETAAIWREECRKAGLGEIHLCAVRFGLETLEGQPGEYGLDSYVLFPPHEAARHDLRSKVLDLHKDFGGEVFDYTAVVDGDIAKYAESYDWPVHRGTMLAWDNTARRLTDARIFHGATPHGFRRWMKSLLEQEMRHNKGSESLVFINAWNEWAEGTYLEPDQRWGLNNLAAYRSAVDAVDGIEPVILPAGIAAQPKLTSRLYEIGSPLDTTGKSPPFPVWHSGTKEHVPDRQTIMVCAHISGHHLFGGERSLLDVLDAMSRLPVNVIVTLPSGNNQKYIEEIGKRCIGIYVLACPQWLDNRAAYSWLTTTFADLIARHKVDVVHANTIMLLEPLQAARRMSRKTVIHSREIISLDSPLQSRMGLDTGEIVTEVFRRSDWVIGNSHATCKLFSRGEQTLYVPNAVHLDDFEMNNKYGSTIKFGIVSSNIPKKGVADFVEVARRAEKRFPQAQFVVIGPDNEQTLSWAEEVRTGKRPDNIRFLGYRDTPRGSISELNVLLNLSNFAESFGRTVAEAMAAKRPVIAYDWGALAELVRDKETGYLVPYRDLDAVVEAIGRLCTNRDLISHMGEAGHAHIKANFTQENLRNALSESYSKILGEPMANRPSVPATAPVDLPPRTTIIIPVYNAPDEVRACIHSVIKHTDLTVNRVIIINDGSPDPAIAPLLAEFNDTPGLTLLDNESNIGYTRTINRGIEEAAQDDVVLLNSDTIVTPRWLEGLRSAAYSREKVATVTAMSDNAGAFSFPTFNAHCPKPDHLSHEEYALLLTQATQDCIPPEVPTGSGFCMFIRRALIEDCGLFDHAGFPRGYGEENDFCMRAYKTGWTHLISPWSFVYHVRTASFKGEKESLVKAGVDVVTKRYPDYSALVKSAFASSEMVALRDASGKSVCT